MESRELLEKYTKRVIIALDVDSLEKARPLIENLSSKALCFKVGLELLTAVGAPKVVDFIHNLGGKVFYDGKFNDIPNTVGQAAKAVATMKVKIFNVHASTGQKSIEAAVANRGDSLVLGVTVLTSIDDEECVSIFGAKPGPKVLQFSRMLLAAKANGIICSPQELELLSCHDDFGGMMKVTPGVRPAWAAVNDQKRVMTPGQAIQAGATALVIGRPITNPPKGIGSPVDVLERINQEIMEVERNKASRDLDGGFYTFDPQKS